MGNGVISLLWQLQCNCNPDHDKFSSFSKGVFIWDDPDEDQWSKIIRIMVDEMSRWILVQSGFNCGGNFSKCLGLWRRSLCSMISGAIDPEKLYRVKFICQYDLCCSIVWASFLFEFFGKIWALARIFWANGLPPSLAKNCPYTYARKYTRTRAPLARDYTNRIFESKDGTTSMKIVN